MEDLDARARDRRHRSSGACSALFDLDGFKRYNDAYGHPAGDALLRAPVGRARPTSSSGHGRAYRLGGDEFCLLLDGGARDADGCVAAAAARSSERGDGFDVTPPTAASRCPTRPTTPRRRSTSPTAACTRRRSARRRPPACRPRDVLLKVLSEREPDLREHSSDVMRSRARVARRLGLTPEERDDRRARGRAARHRQDGDPRRDPQQARAARRPRVALHAPPHDRSASASSTPRRRCSRVGRAGAREPRALGRQRLPRRHRRRGDPARARGSSRSATPSARWCSDRPYRPALTADEALAEIERCAGAQFDPRWWRRSRPRSAPRRCPRERGRLALLVALALAVVVGLAASAASAEPPGGSPHGHGGGLCHAFPWLPRCDAGCDDPVHNPGHHRHPHKLRRPPRRQPGGRRSRRSRSRWSHSWRHPRLRRPRRAERSGSGHSRRHARHSLVAADTLAPSFLAKPRLHPTRFRAARGRGESIAVRTGTTIVYQLSEHPRVTSPSRSTAP